MTSTSSLSRTAVPLQRLYVIRFGFAIVWAALLFAFGSTLGPLSAVLLVLYPLFDVAAAVVDLRSSRATGSVGLLGVNAVVSLLAAIALGIASADGVPAVLRVWGAWAIVAGLVQLTVALRRRALGGQGIMIFSGGLSVVVGAAFVAMAGSSSPSVTTIGGYAAAGGILFLISALRLRSAATNARRDSAAV